MRNIVGLPARYEAVICDHFLINPFGARVPKIDGYLFAFQLLCHKPLLPLRNSGPSGTAG